MNYYLDVLKKYAVFEGRARRKEYWMYFLFNTIVAVLLGAIDGAIGAYGALYLIYILGTFLPGLGVTVRRFHDTGRSGWCIFLGMIPIVGTFIVLYFMIVDSNEGDNKYGPNPKGEDGGDENQDSGDIQEEGAVE